MRRHTTHDTRQLAAQAQPRQPLADRGQPHAHRRAHRGRRPRLPRKRPRELERHGQSRAPQALEPLVLAQLDLDEHAEAAGAGARSERIEQRSLERSADRTLAGSDAGIGAFREPLGRRIGAGAGSRPRTGAGTGAGSRSARSSRGGRDAAALTLLALDRLRLWQALGTSVVLRTADPAATGGGAREPSSPSSPRSTARAAAFAPDSELSRLNAAPGARSQLGPLLLEALALALRAAALTDGDVDPTIGRALELRRLRPRLAAAAGAGEAMSRREPRRPTADGRRVRPGRAELRTLSGWRAVALDRATRPVRAARGRAARPRRDRQSAGPPTAPRQPPRRGQRLRRARQPRRRHRDGRAGAGRRLAHPRDRRPPQRRVGAWADDLDPLGRPCDLEHDRAALEPRGPHDAPHHRPRHGQPGGHALAHGQRRRRRAARDANIATTAALVRGRSALDWLAELGLPARLRRPGRLGYDGRRAGRHEQSAAGEHGGWRHERLRSPSPAAAPTGI